MNLYPRKRPVALTLAGVAAFFAGVTATASVWAGAAMSTPTPAAAATTSSMQMDGAAPDVGTSSASTTSTTSTTSTPTTVPPTTGTSAPVTAAQAIALATGRTHARLDQLDVKTDPTGVSYEVKLVRPDGSDVKVLVVGRTGQVLSEYQMKLLEDREP